MTSWNFGHLVGTGRTRGLRGAGKVGAAVELKSTLRADGPAFAASNGEAMQKTA
jgi:hypothetical protein